MKALCLLDSLSGHTLLFKRYYSYRLTLIRTSLIFLLGALIPSTVDRARGAVQFCLPHRVTPGICTLPICILILNRGIHARTSEIQFTLDLALLILGQSQCRRSCCCPRLGLNYTIHCVRAMHTNQQVQKWVPSIDGPSLSISAQTASFPETIAVHVSCSDLGFPPILYKIHVIPHIHRQTLSTSFVPIHPVLSSCTPPYYPLFRSAIRPLSRFSCFRMTDSKTIIALHPRPIAVQPPLFLYNRLVSSSCRLHPPSLNLHSHPSFTRCL